MAASYRTLQSSRVVLGVAIACSLVAACSPTEAPTSNVRHVAPATAKPADGARRAVDDALARANAAFAAGRLVDPPGRNALELFLAALALDPGNLAAQEAIVELYPVAVGAIESKIRGGAPDDALRVVDLLERAMPGSRAVAEFRATIGEQDAVTSRQRAALADAATRAQAPTEPVAASTAAAGSMRAGSVGASGPTTVVEPPGLAAPAIGATPAVRDETPRETRAEPARAIARRPEPEAIPGAIAPALRATNATSAPEAISRFPAEYPAEARRRRIEGSVELEFTVGTDGRVQNVVVLRAEPTRVFDKAAIRSVQRSRYKPAERDGQPVSARTRTMVNFTLG